MLVPGCSSILVIHSCQLIETLIHFASVVLIVEVLPLNCFTHRKYVCFHFLKFCSDSAERVPNDLFGVCLRLMLCFTPLLHEPVIDFTHIILKDPI